ncbi:MAG: Asp-tRNA(Asn)/Glu-tRNA(Gln) amidotransferase subunit GatA [Acidobacteriota bacterium]|nr:Asp-tRNA(Asn)/Glu-tRNA(Gln) amidotransferase subunit GatA [Acidobacteriota bacterium]MDQ7086872.1 Asp-tRNA(Asn)/Glu-tRNA(Gln) amidotransferase subunit GatA [Acidobacteriota bacterium]
MTTAPMDAGTLATRVRSGETSALEVVSGCLERIRGEALNAVVHRLEDHALEQARRVDRHLAAGEDPGPLAGVPLLVKENICTRTGPTCCGSALLEGYVAPYDATAVERLEAAGAVMVGKTNCDEFGMGSSGETSCHGPVLHPQDPGRVPGGSSSGSAAAVAAGLAPVALGTDTGGSVRQPAALCGVIGLKPTWGRISRWGLVAFASSLDQIGPLCRTVADAALLLEVMGGPDPRDGSQPRPQPPMKTLGALPERGLRVGRIRLEAGEDLHPRVAQALDLAGEAFERDGARVEEVDLPLARETLAIYTLIANAEASSNLARFDGLRYGRQAEIRGGWDRVLAASRGAFFGREVKRRIMLGACVLSGGYRRHLYARAQDLRRELTRSLDALLERVDLLLGPTAPAPAFRFGEKLDDPLEMYRQDRFTLPASLGGHPAISLPAPRQPAELPVAVQLVGGRFREDLLLAGARLLEHHGFGAGAC